MDVMVVRIQRAEDGLILGHRCGPGQIETVLEVASDAVGRDTATLHCRQCGSTRTLRTWSTVRQGLEFFSQRGGAERYRAVQRGVEVVFVRVYSKEEAEHATAEEPELAKG